MPPPSPLNIRLNTVLRLIKEEASYHRELVKARADLEKLQAPGSDADEYAIRQQQTVVKETEVMPEQVRGKLERAIEELETALNSASEQETDETKEKAKKAVQDGRDVIKQHSEPANGV
ncbi:tubulin binding cofactor A [Ascobolus immersus RN42]|uniref:Tubulin-specific chaperone A n=1 Tax=Ascobolus immersus RN42 TaxID=1160509 RepID=A0A3N4IBF1_ASCIM|nr:tubulin binding cofactor A [Ascobolus immersus RN42]